MQDATLRVAKLEKDLELQEEVLKKRHEEINSLNKENARYKDQLDQIRKQFGDMQEIETRIKVAELKEEKINGLLNQLDQIMVRKDYSIYIKIEINREQLKLLYMHADDDRATHIDTLRACILQEVHPCRYLSTMRQEGQG